MKRAVLPGVRSLTVWLAAATWLLPLTGCGGGGSSESPSFRSQLAPSGETPAPSYYYNLAGEKTPQDVHLGHILIELVNETKPTLEEARAALKSFRAGRLNVTNGFNSDEFLVAIPPEYQREGSRGVRRFVEDVTTDVPEVFATPILTSDDGRYGVSWANRRIVFGINSDAVSTEEVADLIASADSVRLSSLPLSTIRVTTYRIEPRTRNGFEVQEIANRLAEHPKTTYADVGRALLSWGP